MWLLLCACPGSPKTDDSAAPTDTDADIDVDTDGPDTGPAATFDPVTPSLVLDYDGTAWTAQTGYWFGSDDLSSIRGTILVDATTTEEFTLQTQGDIHHGGSFPITKVDYVRQISSDASAFHYIASNPPGARLIVEGFSNGEEIFAHLEGEIPMTDTVAGGTTRLTGLTAQSWLVY